MLQTSLQNVTARVSAVCSGHPNPPAHSAHSLAMRSILVLSALTLLGSFDLPAQLSGTYTLDPRGTGTRNFQSFKELAFELVIQGVNGPVSVDVAAGVYNEPLEFYRPYRATKGQEVTIRSASRHAARLTGHPLRGLTYQGTELAYMIFEGLQFEGTSSHLNCHTVVFDDCKFQDARLTVVGESNKIRHCEFSAKSTPLTVQGPGNSIHQNYIHLERIGDLAAFTGAGIRKNRMKIHNNIFTAADDASIELKAGLEFIHNTIVQFSSPTSGGGFLIEVNSSFINYPLVMNNIVVSLGAARMMQLYGDTTIYDVQMRNNLYWSTSTPSFRWGNNNFYSSLFAWQTATGLDQNSVFMDPQFSDLKSLPLGLRPTPRSPAFGRAAPNPSYLTTDYEDKTRNSPATIGAFEGVRGAIWATAGQGCPGSGNTVPEIGYSGTAVLGSTDFTVTLSKALGGVTVQGFLALGVLKTNLNLGGTCNLLVQPNVILQTNVAGSGAGTGTAGFKLPIPNNPVYQGRSLRFQWAVADAAAPGLGLATSQAADLTL